MGAAQGKLETVNAVAILAEATGRTIAETGTTVWRPPYSPTTLGALAGRIFEPVRYSPMQPWHERHGAKRSEEHTSELQSRQYLVCRLLLEKKTHHRYWSPTVLPLTRHQL